MRKRMALRTSFDFALLKGGAKFTLAQRVGALIVTLVFTSLGLFCFLAAVKNFSEFNLGWGFFMLFFCFPFLIPGLAGLRNVLRFPGDT